MTFRQNDEMQNSLHRVACEWDPADSPGCFSDAKRELAVLPYGYKNPNYSESQQVLEGVQIPAQRTQHKCFRYVMHDARNDLLRKVKLNNTIYKTCTTE